MPDIENLLSKQARQSISKAAPTPLYFQLYELLKNLILNGTLPRGERMPTEEQLAEHFSVSRITAKRSMDELAAEGLVERRRGKGTHVIYAYEPKPVKAPLVGMLQEIESMARNTRASVLTCDTLQPPQAIREELGLANGDTALHLVRVRERDGIKFGYYTSWTRDIKKPRKKSVFETTPRLSYFREQGLAITHVTQTISAVAADEALAGILDIPVGSPLLSLTRRSYQRAGGKRGGKKADRTERMVDFMHVLYNPEHFQYKMDLEVD